MKPRFSLSACNIQVLSIDTLIANAIEAFHNKEMQLETDKIFLEEEQLPNKKEVSVNFVLSFKNSLMWRSEVQNKWQPIFMSVYNCFW